jgi:hypothetical protein
MKKAILVTAISLMGMSAFAEEKVHCLVHKFDGPYFNFTNDETITFRGEVKSDELLVVNANGTSRVIPDTSKVNQKDAQFYQVGELLNLVILTNVKNETAAMGNRGTSLVDLKKGISVTCGISDLNE